jgi:hypothetical protein
MTINLGRFKKCPHAVHDYTVDWTAWLDDDTISTSTWTIPSGITNDQDAVSEDDLTAIIWLSGGTANTDYECRNTIVTNGGRTNCATLLIQVR